MAFAEYDVLIKSDAMSVYNYLADARNLQHWRVGIRNIELQSGAEGAKGAVYRQLLTGPGGRTVAGEIEILEARPGAEIQYQVTIGQTRPRGGYYLSTEGQRTRVRFALECQPKGILDRLRNPLRRAMNAEVCQLERLKAVLEDMPHRE